MRAILILLCGLLMSGVAMTSVARAAPSTFELLNGLPPVVNDTMRPGDCTVTYLVADVATNDTIAVPMQIAPDKDDQPVNNAMPCPREVPPRVAARALDACIIRAADPKNCVYADTARGFETRPIADNTAENSSRCMSDKAHDIGVACWRSGELQICDVGCGNSPAEATAAAVSRCEAKHQRQCPITGSLPVLAPK